jgi:uncharacterized membrane protein YgdD (TMEM256/DUF423 family)
MSALGSSQRLAVAAILFLAAGDWGWPQGWVFLGEVAVSTFAVNLWLARHDPALLASRLSAPVQRDQRPWDRTFMLAGLLVFVGWLVLCALDARRLRVVARSTLRAGNRGCLDRALHDRCLAGVSLQQFRRPAGARADRAAATRDHRWALPYRSPSDVRRCATEFVGIGRVGLDLVAARLTPHDESDASRSRVAERHRRPGGSRLHCRGHERAGALINSACHGCTEVPK